jgi:hypothetical protein
MLLVHHADHLFPRNLERCTDNNGSGSGHVQPTHAGKRRLSNEFSGGKKRDSGLLALLRNDGEFSAARPKIEDGVSRTSLRKEGIFGLQLDEFSPYSRFFKKCGEVKGHASHLR